MMFGDMAKADFENVFLEEQGEDFSHFRNGTRIGIVCGICEDDMIQCKADSDVREGDVLRSELQGMSYSVRKVTFDTAGGVRVCLNAHVS